MDQLASPGVGVPLYEQGSNLDLTSAAVAEALAEEDEAVERYIPGLTSPSLFNLLPMTDGLTPLLEKYLAPQDRPARDLTGDAHGKGLDAMIAERKWRCVARLCQDIITNASPERTSYILFHWSLRLHALLRLSLIPLLANEISSLASLLSLPPPFATVSSPQSGPPSPTFPSHPASVYALDPAIPFSIYLLLAAVPSIQGAPEESVERLSVLARASKEEMWRAGQATDLGKTWMERVKEVGGMLSVVLLEVKSDASVSSLLGSSSYQDSPPILASLCRINLHAGDLAAFDRTATRLATSVDEGDEGRRAAKTTALGLVGRQEWKAAEDAWRALIHSNAEDVESVTNLAVSLLYSSQLNAALSTLNEFLASHPTLGYSSPSLLFNLSTLIELRMEPDVAVQAKIELLKGVIQYGGDGVDRGCLKLAV